MDKRFIKVKWGKNGHGSDFKVQLIPRYTIRQKSPIKIGDKVVATYSNKAWKATVISLNAPAPATAKKVSRIQKSKQCASKRDTLSNGNAPAKIMSIAPCSTSPLPSQDESDHPLAQLLVEGIPTTSKVTSAANLPATSKTPVYGIAAKPTSATTFHKEPTAARYSYTEMAPSSSTSHLQSAPISSPLKECPVLNIGQPRINSTPRHSVHTISRRWADDPYAFEPEMQRMPDEDKSAKSIVAAIEKMGEAIMQRIDAQTESQNKRLDKIIELLSIRRQDRTLQTADAQPLPLIQPLIPAYDIVNDDKWNRPGKFDNAANLTRALATELASKSYFGDNVLVRSNVTADNTRRNLRRLNIQLLAQLRGVLMQKITQRFHVADMELESLWAVAEEAIQKKCYNLRSRSTLQATSSDLARLAMEEHDEENFYG